jgi:hypothetical protein
MVFLTFLEAQMPNENSQNVVLFKFMKNKHSPFFDFVFSIAIKFNYSKGFRQFDHSFCLLTLTWTSQNQIGKTRNFTEWNY